LQEFVDRARAKQHHFNKAPVRTPSSQPPVASQTQKPVADELEERIRTIHTTFADQMFLFKAVAAQEIGQHVNAHKSDALEQLCLKFQHKINLASAGFEAGCRALGLLRPDDIVATKSSPLFEPLEGFTPHSTPSPPILASKSSTHHFDSDAQEEDIVDRSPRDQLPERRSQRLQRKKSALSIDPTLNGISFDSDSDDTCSVGSSLIKRNRTRSKVTSAPVISETSKLMLLGLS